MANLFMYSLEIKSDLIYKQTMLDKKSSKEYSTKDEFKCPFLECRELYEMK